MIVYMHGQWTTEEDTGITEVLVDTNGYIIVATE